ncbi:MAG: hypothetical protein IJO65_12675 [Lachnospiraceae bacterium]|nr:hypothetical protein [Lachnospiraceae bacterium]
MRLYTIYKMCKNNIELLDRCEYFLSRENEKFMLVVEGWCSAKQAIEEMYKIDAFRGMAKEIYDEVPPLYREEDTWKIPSKENDFSRHFSTLRNEIQGVIRIYESFGYENDRLGIDVKMPVGDFKEFVDNLKSLEYILDQCPTLKVNDGEIEFNNVDVGSTWFTFLLKGSGANFLAKQIANLIDKAIGIKSHWVTIKQQEEMLQTMEIKNEMLASVKETFDIMREAVMKNALDELQTEERQYQDGEERDKTKVALEKLVGLLDKGMEIYASIDTPQEIQALFPMSESQKLLENEMVKLLSDDKSEQVEE